MKNFSDFVNEGYSNYKDITTKMRNQIESKWDRIVDRKGKTSFNLYFDYYNNFYKSNEKTKVIIKFDPNNYGSYIKKDFQKYLEDL